MAIDSNPDSPSGGRPDGDRFSSFAKNAPQLLDPILSSRFIRSVVLPVVVLLVALKLLMLSCITYVGPNEYGIKVVRLPILGARGVHHQVYPAGFHIVLKPFNAEQMFLFAKDVQVLDFTGGREESS